jgi:hypothetical protein
MEIIKGIHSIDICGQINEEVINLEWSCRKINDLIKEAKIDLFEEASYLKHEVDALKEKLKEKIDIICYEIIQKLENYQKMCFKNMMYHRNQQQLYQYYHGNLLIQKHRNQYLTNTSDDTVDSIVIKKENIGIPLTPPSSSSEPLASSDIYDVPIKNEIVNETDLNTHTLTPCDNTNPLPVNHAEELCNNTITRLK